LSRDIAFLLVGMSATVVLSGPFLFLVGGLLEQIQAQQTLTFHDVPSLRMQDGAIIG
jgi:hypothetical protein